jgi:CBS domain-containing protein
MNNHLPIISPGDDIIQAAKVMVNRNVRVLPVAQNGKLLGLFTLDNLAGESLALATMVFSKTIKPGVSREVKA